MLLGATVGEGGTLISGTTVGGSFGFPGTGSGTAARVLSSFSTADRYLSSTTILSPETLSVATTGMVRGGRQNSVSPSALHTSGRNFLRAIFFSPGDARGETTALNSHVT